MTIPGSDFCDVCQRDVPTGGWDTHAAGRMHCRNIGLKTEAALQSAQKDRNGVSVPTQNAELDFGVVDPSDASTVQKSFTLVTKQNAEFMILEPQWVSNSIRKTACVFFFAWCHMSSNKSALPAVFHVLSKVTLISPKVTLFELSWACGSPELVNTKTRWRSDLQRCPMTNNSNSP